MRLHLTYVPMKYFWIATCCLLFFSVPAWGDEGELRLIKQNIVELLVPTENKSPELAAALMLIEPETEVSDQMVVELHQRYPFDLKRINTYIETIQDDGSWSDIHYQDQKKSGWEAKVHTERILELVKLYTSQQTAYYQSPEVKAIIRKALDFWFNAKLVSPNWWHNQIGVPKILGNAFILFEDHLTPRERAEAIALMENAKFGMTGQNKVWLAGNVMMRALLQNDYALVKEARDQIVSEIVTNRKEGIQPDGSFHQHGTQLQFGNYGLAFISGMSSFSHIFSGTSLAFEEHHIEVLNVLLEEGYQWVIWQGMMDISALGRQFFRNAPLHKALSVAFAASELGDDAFFSRVDSFTGHKHFWLSDYTVHRRPGWMASVKMASERVIGTETLNGDNMKGFYTADGATYIYGNDRRYLNIFPYWDWRKLPGVTAPDVDTPMKTTGVRNRSGFVGGVSVGEEGMSAMILNRDGVKAYKSWLFTKGYVFCLGSGIGHSEAVPLATSIEQCFKAGELVTLESDAGEQRFFHYNTGYIVWKDSPCIATTETRPGVWHDIMQMYTPRQEPERDIVSLYIPHTDPREATYQYLILPEATQEQTAGFDLSIIQVLQNDTSAQIIYLPEDKVYWVAAYEPLKLQLSSTQEVEIDTPGIYKLLPEGGSCRIWYADPGEGKTREALQVI